jgi:hypothetical protein
MVTSGSVQETTASQGNLPAAPAHSAGRSLRSSGCLIDVYHMTAFKTTLSPENLDCLGCLVEDCLGALDLPLFQDGND